ncbi:MAG: 1-acyl-sn-glycerol-3-phosphate acyltransferase, partial [Caulobacterales bacterium]|nr:1-acyl-sn-glycerol-3-phosphate acyltransferase [Caulobacterales bacterium]
MQKKLNFIQKLAFKIWFALAILFVGGFGAIAVFINKKHALCVTNIWARTTLWGAKHIAGLEIELRGKENLPDGQFFIAGKHLSTLDTLAPFTFTKTPAFIFKNELFKIPIFGWYLKVAGMIGIDRDGGMAALKSMV